MMVRADGTNVGSIGGGCVEAEVWQAARDAMGGEGARVLSFRLNARDMAESGLVCGGTVEILVESLDSTHEVALRAARELQASGLPGVLVTVLPRDDAGGATLKFLLTERVGWTWL